MLTRNLLHIQSEKCKGHSHITHSGNHQHPDLKELTYWVKMMVYLFLSCGQPQIINLSHQVLQPHSCQCDVNNPPDIIILDHHPKHARPNSSIKKEGFYLHIEGPVQFGSSFLSNQLPSFNNLAPAVSIITQLTPNPKSFKLTPLPTSIFPQPLTTPMPDKSLSLCYQSSYRLLIVSNLMLGSC